MGWASGGEVFEPVADVMIHMKLTDAEMYLISVALINGLQSRGWDTENESLGMYQDYPAIVAAFKDCGIPGPDAYE